MAQHWDSLSKQDQQHVHQIAKHLDENTHHGQAMRQHTKNQDHKSATDLVVKIGKELGIIGGVGSAAGIALYFITLK